MRGFLKRRWWELRSVVVYLYVVLALLLVGPAMIVYLLIRRDFPRAYRWGRRIIRWGLRLAGIQVDVSFRAGLPDPPVLFVANHQSLLDPPILLAYLPHDVRVFPKVQLFRVPIMGALMRVAGFVPVDRERRELRKALDRLRQRVSFLIFPEGTRSPTGRLQAFRRGGFVLAIEAGRAHRAGQPLGDLRGASEGCVADPAGAGPGRRPSGGFDPRPHVGRPTCPQRSGVGADPGGAPRRVGRADILPAGDKRRYS